MHIGIDSRLLWARCTRGSSLNRITSYSGLVLRVCRPARQLSNKRLAALGWGCASAITVTVTVGIVGTAMLTTWPPLKRSDVVKCFDEANALPTRPQKRAVSAQLLKRLLFFFFLFSAPVCCTFCNKVSSEMPLLWRTGQYVCQMAAAPSVRLLWPRAFNFS